MQEAVRQLIELGLTDKEAAVYLALLELGPSPVQDVAMKSGSNRSTVYAVLESLRTRGLATVEENGKRAQYRPAPPERLEKLLHEEQELIQQKIATLGTAMPLFRAVYNSTPGKPSVRFFEGEEGIREAREILMQTGGGEFLSFCALDEQLSKLSSTDERQRLMMNRRMKGRCLVARKPEFSLPSLDARNWSLKEISFDAMPFTGEMNIIGNVVAAFVVPDQPIAFIVEHPLMANLFRACFELAWRSQP